MNLNLNKEYSLKYPGSIISKNLVWEDLEELIVNDANKDIEDEKLNVLLESVQQDTFPSNSPKAVLYVDTLLQFLHLKIKKRYTFPSFLHKY